MKEGSIPPAPGGMNPAPGGMNPAPPAGPANPGPGPMNMGLRLKLGSIMGGTNAGGIIPSGEKAGMNGDAGISLSCDKWLLLPTASCRDPAPDVSIPRLDLTIIVISRIIKMHVMPVKDLSERRFRLEVMIEVTVLVFRTKSPDQ